MADWIKLHRDILNSDVFASQKMLKIWIWCLCKANFKDRTVPLKTGRGETLVKVKRGQFIFGRFKAEEDLYIDGSTIYKIMQRLEKMNNIKIQSNNQYSIVTISNYNDYQKNEILKVTANEQPTNSQVTAKGQASNTDNNDKKEKKGKNVYTHPIQKFIIEEDLSNVMKLSKQLTEKEAIKLEQDYIMKDINKMLLQMENYKLLSKKSTSVNLTIRNWLGRDGVQKMDAGELKRQADMKKYSM